MRSLVFSPCSKLAVQGNLHDHASLQVPGTRSQDPAIPAWAEGRPRSHPGIPPNPHFDQRCPSLTPGSSHRNVAMKTDTTSGEKQQNR